MKQAIMLEPGKIEFKEVPVPNIESNQVKLKIESIGVCGSDIHVNHGNHPYTSYPVVQGHEVAAEVLDIGENVKNVNVGDRVTVQPQVICGECYQCQCGMYNVCEKLKVMGFQTTGMASEFFVINSDKLITLPKSINMDHGALIEPLAVAVHAVKRIESVEDKKILVLGGGPIGNLVAQTSKALGAKSVLVSEVSPYRIEIAERCGVETVNTQKEDLFDSIINNFGEEKADIIFDCVGINTTMNQAIEYARKGSSIVLVGVFSEVGQVNLGLVQDYELTIKGSAMYREEDYLEAIDLIEKKLIDLDVLITNHVKFKDFKKAYELIDNYKDEVMKIMIDMN